MKTYTLLTAIFISLVGNLIAEFSLFWSALGGDTQLSLLQSSNSKLSLFFVGQALGFTILSPLLGWFFDHLKKRTAALFIDFLYALSFLICWFLISKNQLSHTYYFIFGTVLSALGALYRNAVIYSIFKELSKKMEINFIVSRFSYMFAYTFAIGFGLSGFIVESIGAQMALIFGILTFIPMPFIYSDIFKKNSSKTSKNINKNIFLGLQKIFKNKPLSSTCSAVTVANLSASILPGFMAIALSRLLPQIEPYISILISITLILSTFFIPFLEKLSKKMSLNRLILTSFIPSGIFFLIASLYHSSFLYIFAYLISLVGVTLSNIVSGIIRVKSSSENDIGQINTSYFSLVSLGQILGSLFIIPIALKSFSFAALIIAFIYVFAAGIGYFTAPKKKLSEFQNI